MQVMGTPFELRDFLTAGCAVLGAGLGVLNTITSLNQRRVKLRVTPKFSVRTERGVYSHKTEIPANSVPAIEVINLSEFPVTISEAGFSLRRDTGRLTPTPPFLNDDKPWPRRLESRESVTIYFPSAAKLPSNLHLAYATTDCEETRYGDSPALKAFRARIKKVS